MKKIIYSLVIMIAAGSLFTSCIEPIEPVGIFDLREAKARYYDALSELRKADALVQQANAKLILAQEALVQQQVEGAKIANKMAELAYQLQQAIDEVTKQDLKYQLAQMEEEQKATMAALKAATLLAEEALRQAQSAVDMAKLDLTIAEQEALDEAMARYTAAYEDYLDAQVDLLEAQQELWEFEYEVANMYDSEGIFTEYYGKYIRTGLDYEEYLESCILYYGLQAAMWEAYKEQLEDNSTLADWNEDLEDLKEAYDELRYGRYQVTEDSAYYMATVYHEGFREFEMKAQKWVNDNPAVANPGSKPSNPDPKAAKYQKETYYADSIKFEALKYDESPAFAKFRSMLSSYTTVASIASKDTTTAVIVDDATAKTLTLVANQKNSQFKDFVLGTKNTSVIPNGTKMTYYDKTLGKNVEVEADYGLLGALDVLEREKVLKDEDKATEEELKEELAKRKKTWEDDRAALLAFYDEVKKAEKDAKIDPYSAYKPIADAKAALKKAKDDDAAGNSGLAGAAQDLMDALNDVIPHADLTKHDTAALVDAIVAFAKAREKYLPYKPYQYGSAIDSNIFYYAYAESPALIDSATTFKDLTVENFKKNGRFNWAWSNLPTKPETAADLSAGMTKQGAFMNIFNQLLSPAIAAKLETPAPVTVAEINAGNAFYGTYEFVPASGDDPAYMVYAGTTTKVVNPDVEKAEKALADACKKFDALMLRYWGVVTTVDGTNYNIFKKGATYGWDKYSPDVYTLKTFMDPYRAVIFDAAGTTIQPTKALQAILGTVDPNADPTKPNGENFAPIATTSQIFWNNDTDFYYYMKAQNALDEGTDDESIVKIREWIEGVIMAFGADETAAQQKAESTLATDQANVEKAQKTWETNKAKYDAYMEKLKAYCGKNYVTDLAGKSTPKYMTIAAPVDYASASVKQTQVGPFEWEGAWVFEGQQLADAEACVPGYPEKLAEWHTTAAETAEEMADLKALIDALEDAYVYAATKIAREMGINVEDLAEIGFEAIDGKYEVFDQLISYCQEEIEDALWYVSDYEDALAAFQAGMSDIDVTRMILENEVEKAELALFNAEVALQAAEDYYNNVLSHIFGEN
ncbi:MAG: hypothetical protein IKS47_04285 [Bacteroidales bacterium]|nr:hypothetical protein [Bacteroidales bacterium]